MWTYQREQEPSYQVVARVPAYTGPATTPVFYNRELPPDADTEWRSEYTAPRLRLLSYQGLHLYPRHVLVDPSQARVMPITFKKHRHHAHNGVIHTREDHFELRDESLRTAIAQTVDRPVYVADTEYPGIYGHDLVEVLTGAWAWRHAGEDALFATSTKPRPYLVDLLRAAGVPTDSMLFFDQPLAAAQVLFPEAPVVARRYVHPVAFELFEKVRTALADGRAKTPERLYVSRSHVGERPLVNEAAVEELAAQYGFAVIHPQEHSIAEQVTLFSNARLIMGTGGSALHNAVFAAPNARVLMLSSESWLTVVDTLLDRGQQRLGYVVGLPTSSAPRSRRRHKGPWIIDPDDVRHAMTTHFDLPAKRGVFSSIRSRVVGHGRSSAPRSAR